MMAWNVRCIIGSSRSIFRDRLSRSTVCIARPMSTVDSKEIKHFSAYKNDWWSENGPFQALQNFTPLRVKFVRDQLANVGVQMQNPALPLDGVNIVDVGCGGGILSEGLARIGAQVTGIDASAELIGIAKEHAKLDSSILERVNYIHTTVEDFSQKKRKSYDAIIASEVLEHVVNPQQFLKECVKIIKPGGSIFITTENRTLTSWLVVIIAAEYIFHKIPVGTHQWNKFITPQEVQHMLENYGCRTRFIHGIKLNPWSGQWSWTPSTAMCYALHAVK